jgi:hypothetical protein
MAACVRSRYDQGCAGLGCMDSSTSAGPTNLTSQLWIELEHIEALRTDRDVLSRSRKAESKCTATAIPWAELQGAALLRP